MSDLKAALANLVESLKRVDLEPSNDDLELLKTVVQKSYSVSNLGRSRSLEKTLELLGLDKNITESRAVLEIDKLGKYFDLCKDLIHLGRQAKTRMLLRNLKLERCVAYPCSKPSGSRESCYVHGEVQLILFYELHHRQPSEQLPRAIGSSKSACFLCDCFIKNHGSFGVSYSHMQLHPKWTIPEAPWMVAEQIQRMRSLVQAIDGDVQTLLKQNMAYRKPAIQSRASLPLTNSTPDISILSSQLSEGRMEMGRAAPLQTANRIPSPLNYLGSMMSQRHFYSLQDLPITISILPSMPSCTLLCGKVDYIFDLKEVQHGQLLITTSPSNKTDVEHRRVDVRQLESSSQLKIFRQGNLQSLSISVHDANNHEIYMKFIWSSE